MNSYFNSTILLLFVLFTFSNCAEKQKDTVVRIPEVEALISQMSLVEKVGQTTQITLDAITIGDSVYVSDEPITLDTALLAEAVNKYHVGSVLNTANNRALTPQKWKSIISEIQNAASQNKLQIPVLYGVDAIHGATYTAGSTLSPQEIAIAATWNKDIALEAAKITAYETRACHIPWTFSPVLDLGKDPRWPRIWETYGEDPYLCSVMGVQTIKGYQGDAISGPTNVAACLKHFIGYSAANSGKDRTPGELSDIALREYHLPAFEAAIDAGAASVMINSGIINGTPVHANYKLLTTLLKEELGFNGLVVTDWADIENLHKRDRVAQTHKEAIKMAINAGIDMSMVPYLYKRYCDFLVELVNEGEVTMERLDDAVRRTLNLKYQLGLFSPENGVTENYSKFGSEAFEEVAYQAASEAMTLLKNENNILPLKKGSKILVSGPNGNSMRTLNGGWSYSWQGKKVERFAAQYNTFYEAIANEFGSENVSYTAGVEYRMDGPYQAEHKINIAEAVKAAANVDVVVVCVGENSYTEKPGDLNDLMISENQENLVAALAKAGKPVVLVLNEGRPRIIRNMEPQVKAIVHTYLSGNFAGDALADVLSGDVNPSGKLPYTYPKYSNSLVVYNHKPSEESDKPEGMYDYGGGFFPQYPFGYGLSYTNFSYSDLSVSTTTFSEDESVTVSVKVKNTGRVSGKEVVQLYSSDLYASITPDIKRLRAFDKIALAPGEEKTVSFSINAKDLSFINAQSKRVTEEGDFSLSINTLSTIIKFQK